MAFRRVVISGEKVQDTKTDLDGFFSNKVFKTNYPGLKTKLIVSPVKNDTIVIDLNGDGADTVAKKVKDIGQKYKMKAVIKLEKPMSVVKETKITKSKLDVNSVNEWWNSKTKQVMQQSNPTKKGCLIATAAYGTELSPQVQLLREVRDNVLFGTNSGTAFMTGFNEFYYSFSPAIADWERQSPLFKETVKLTITPMLSTMSILNYANIHSEQQMFGYGIGVILLNIGMYFVAPAIIIVKIQQRIRKA